METKCITLDNNVETCIADSRLPILYPVVVGGPETSISVDTETTSISSSESESECTNDVVALSDFDNNALAQGSTIHVENSTDVVIGPLTRFHGPVTIYQTISSNTQNQNGILGSPETNKIVITPSFNKQEREIVELSKDRLFRLGYCKWMILLCVILAVIGVITSMVLVFNNNSHDNSLDKALEHDNNNTPLSNLSFRIYSENDWFGKHTNFSINLLHPTKYAVVSHTASSFCSDFTSCSTTVRNIQSYHIQYLRHPDIGYNFLIGGDGDVYIGRGWDKVNFHKNRSIEVSLIGNFESKDKMTPKMISTLQELLELGIKLEKLSKNYKLVCHNQIEHTLSPGASACEEVSKLPHYMSGWVNL